MKVNEFRQMFALDFGQLIHIRTYYAQDIANKGVTEIEFIARFVYFEDGFIHVCSDETFYINQIHGTEKYDMRLILDDIVSIRVIRCGDTLA
jgi:hypothetical protein